MDISDSSSRVLQAHFIDKDPFFNAPYVWLHVKVYQHTKNMWKSLLLEYYDYNLTCNKLYIIAFFLS